MRLLPIPVTCLVVGCTPRASKTPTSIPPSTQAQGTATARPSATPAATAVDTLTPAASTVQVTVVRVIDGDTIEILAGERVRYLGIDSPDPNRCYGPKAVAKNRELVDGKKVILEGDVSERDAFGRLLRYVYVDGFFVNAELVRSGYAVADSRSSDVRYQDLLIRLEQEARQRQLGLCGPACATPARIGGAGQIAITDIFYDGVVPRVESDEYVEFRNQSTEAVDMSGWKLVSLAGA